ncbi:MAG: response regulator [Desulfobacterales bacterium]|nr:response regulator [Desulfobacterales bacterium]
MIMLLVFFSKLLKKNFTYLINDVEDSKKRNISNRFFFKDFDKIKNAINTMIEDHKNEYKNLNLDLEKRTNELKLAKEFAVANNHFKSAFLANMSHEIRTPINAIIGYTGLTFKTELSLKQRDYLGKIRSSTHLLLGILNDILDFSKIEADKIEIEEIEFKLQDVLEVLTDLFADQASKKNIELIIDREQRVPCYLIGDALRLRQILVNLTGNAVKFTEKGEILIKVKCIEQDDKRAVICFTVQDTGIGIEHDILTKLFTPFTQADSSTTRKYGGTGLGLAISMKLAELMNGKIEVFSKIGKGSNFSFTVPLKIQTQKQGPKQLTDNIKGLKTLIIDDNQTTLEVLKKITTSFGLIVDTSSSAETALSMLEDTFSSGNLYSLILMDWIMPSMDGIEASRIIKNDPRFESIPIILVTAFGRDSEIKLAEEIGINAFLTKPIKQSILFDTIIEVLRKKFNFIESNNLSFFTQTSQLENTIIPKNVKILLVEDNPINQEVACEILKDAGIQVNIANNGKEAIDKVKLNIYDAVLMDMQMPEMDGYEATKLIREWETEEKNERVPIIAMTAHAMKGDREKCLNAGMDDYLTKPIDPDILIKILDRWIKNKATKKVESNQANNKTYDHKNMKSDPINIEAGIKRVAGNQKLFFKLLKEFYSSYINLVDNVKKHLTKNELEKARILIHTIKGVSGNLSADRLHNISKELELCIKEKKLKDISNKISKFESEMNQLLDFIKNMETITKKDDNTVLHQGKTADLKDVKTKINNLMILLEESNMEAETALQSLKQALAPYELVNDIKLIEEQIDELNYTDAQNTLLSIARTLGISLE